MSMRWAASNRRSHLRGRRRSGRPPRPLLRGPRPAGRQLAAAMATVRRRRVDRGAAAMGGLLRGRRLHRTDDCGPVRGPIATSSTRPIRLYPAGMDVHVSLDGRRDITGQIYRQLRAAIVTGTLRPGDRLPPTRELADRLAVSRTTVMVAYDRLMGEGFLTGTSAPGRSSATTSPPRRPVPPRRTGRCARATCGPRSTSRSAGSPCAPLRLPLRAARRHPLPVRVLAATHRPVSSAPSGVGRAKYGEPAGHPRCARRSPVTSASSRAVRATRRRHRRHQRLPAGDRPRGPGAPGAGRPGRRRGPRLPAAAQPAADDGHGRRARPGRRRGHRRGRPCPTTPGLVFVTPSHQFPLGHVMSLRAAAGPAARGRSAHDAAIIEDDYDSEFRFGGRPDRAAAEPRRRRPRPLLPARSPRRCCRRCASASSSRRRRCARRCAPPSTSPTGRRRRRSSWRWPGSSTAAGSPATSGRCARCTASATS